MERDPAVQALIDRQAITDTLYRYASTIDHKDFAALRLLFTDDATARYGERDWMIGADDLLAYICEHGRTRTWQHHLLSVYHVDIDGDRAEALVYHTSHEISLDDPDTVSVIVARYYDELARQGDGWKIAKLRMEVGWRELRHTVQARR